LGVKAAAGVGDGGLLALPVGLAVEDEFVGGGLEPVDGGLGEEWVGHEAEPLDGLAVGGDDRGGGAVSFRDEFVDVGGVEGVERLESEVVELSRCRDRSIYADLVTIPTRGGARCGLLLIVRAGIAASVGVVGIVTGR
jgi:hypothetical protein